VNIQKQVKVTKQMNKQHKQNKNQTKIRKRFMTDIVTNV